MNDYNNGHGTFIYCLYLHINAYYCNVQILNIIRLYSDETKILNNN